MIHVFGNGFSILDLKVKVTSLILNIHEKKFIFLAGILKLSGEFSSNRVYSISILLVLFDKSFSTVDLSARSQVKLDKQMREWLKFFFLASILGVG